MRIEVKVIATPEEVNSFNEGFREFNDRYPTPEEVKEEFFDRYHADPADYDSTCSFAVEVTHFSLYD